MSRHLEHMVNYTECVNAESWKSPIFGQMWEKYTANLQCIGSSEFSAAVKDFCKDGEEESLSCQVGTGAHARSWEPALRWKQIFVLCLLYCPGFLLHHINRD